MVKCAKKGSFQVSSCKTSEIFVPFVCMYIMLLNLVHELKFETNLTLYPCNPTSTFRNDDFLGSFSESLLLNFNIHPYASFLSICKIMAVSIPSALAQ